MKKISILAALALGAALIFSGCDTDAVTEAISELTDSTTEDTTTDDDTTTSDEAADETADEEADETDGLVIWENSEGETFTTSGYSISLSLDEVLDLTGYKYLNIEFAAPGNAESGQNVIVQPMSDQNGGGHPQGNICQSGAISKATYQTEFGTTYGSYTDWSSGAAVETEIEDDYLGSVQLYVQETTTWGTVDGVEITVYKITATNTAL